MTRIAYRPAPALEPWAVEVSGGVLTVVGRWQVDLARVERVRFAQQRFGQNVMRRLDLTVAGEVQTLGLTLPAAALPDDADAAAHRVVMQAVIAALMDVRPDVEVEIGAPGGARTLLFGLGVLALVSGVGIVALGAGQDRMADVAVPAGLLLVLGAGLGWTGRPGRPVPQVGLSDCAEVVARLDRV